MVRQRSFPRYQQGVTLIELMVGIALGLMVIAVAMVALMTSRSISGTVSDASAMQQQAAYAFDVIGRQIRQAGSLELSLNPDFSFSSSNITFDALQPVAFDAPDPTGTRPPFDRKVNTLSGTTTPAFTVGYQNYTESIKPAGTQITESQLRDCLGQNPGKATPASAPVLSSSFQRNSSNELVCTGAGGGGTQAIIDNVTDLQIRYAVQPKGTSTMQYISSPAAIDDWSRVYAVEVCLELTSKESVSVPASATYTNCSGDDDASYDNRLKMVFRSTYQLRSQGQVD